jgi:threonine synthase
MCDEVMITLATAHPAKFFKAFESSTGKKPVMPKSLSDLFNKEERITELPNNLDQIKRVILERI